MDKSIYQEFFVLVLSKLLMYETYYDKWKPNFGQKFLRLHFRDCNSIV